MPRFKYKRRDIMILLLVGFNATLPERMDKLFFQFSTSRVKTSYVTKE